jgi:hypothetical protein
MIDYLSYYFFKKLSYILLLFILPLKKVETQLIILYIWNKGMFSNMFPT